MKTNKPAIFFIVFLSAAIAGARDIYVSWQGTNNYPFTNWPDAATNIEWAVNVGVNGDTVWISNGTYYLTNQITVISNITICGNPGEQPVVDGCSAHRCFYLTSAATAPVLSNLFITHGYRSNVAGGGVYMYRGTLRNCVFSNNISLTNGGGVFMYYGTVRDCTFIDNKGGRGGGLAGMDVSEAKLIDHCLFHTNIAYQGGGIYHDTAGSIITACVFTCNVASNSYGGIYLHGATTPNAMATHCTFASNVALAGGGGGGYCYKAYFTNCYVSNNIASQSAGGLYVSGSVKNSVIARNQNLGTISGYSGGGLRISGSAIDCIIEENTSSKHGGGVFLPNNGLLRNCLIRNNRASDKGGGVFWYDLNARIYSCTIVSNYAASGGGLWAYAPSPDYNYIENTIIYFNTGGASSNYLIEAGCQPTFTNCCLAPELAAGITNINVITDNPQFVDKDSANWRLKGNSPCVNAGVNRGWMASAVDLDGHSRIDRFSGIVDMGCFEDIPSGTMFMIGIGQ